MKVDPRNIEVVDDEMAEVYRQKTPTQRLEMCLRMWNYARRRVDAAVRWQHPDWDEPMIKKEVNRRMSGSA